MNDIKSLKNGIGLGGVIFQMLLCYEYSSIYATNGKRFTIFAPCIHRVAFGHANRAVSHGGTLTGCEL